MSDFIQNTFTNLITYPLSSYVFPIATRYQPIPWTGTECLFNELVTNGVYTTLPGFRSLKANVMDPIMRSNVNTKVTMLIVFIIQLLILVAFVVGMLKLNKKVTELKNDSY